MSHRTEDLPPLTGPAHFLRELRYHEASRQSFALILVLLFCLTMAPVPLLVIIGLPIALAGEAFRLYASGFIVKNQELATDGPYRFVRHPLMACLLVVLWAQPVMRADMALLAAGLSAYILLGVVLEERDLARRFGPDYDHYRHRVPALVPWRWPARLP